MSEIYRILKVVDGFREYYKLEKHKRFLFWKYWGTHRRSMLVEEADKFYPNGATSYTNNHRMFVQCIASSKDDIYKIKEFKKETIEYRGFKINTHLQKKYGKARFNIVYVIYKINYNQIHYKLEHAKAKIDEYIQSKQYITEIIE